VRQAGVGTTSLDLFNWAAIGRFFLLVKRSVSRHRAVFFSVWFCVVGVTIALMVVLPKTYEVQTTLQAQKSDVITSLSSRRVQGGPDPSRQAAETVLRHDNLVALIRQTDLIRRWPERRAPLARLKDAIWARFFRRPTPDEEIENFVGLLEKRLWVDTSEGIVSIGIHFPDGELAFRVVDAALENFLEARHAAEISSIGDAIVVLENRTTKSREALQVARDQLEALRAARAAKQGKSVRRPTAVSSSLPLDPKVSELQVQVQTRRRAIADLQEFRRRRVTELEARLEELRSLYSPSHPSVLDVQQSLETMRSDSPQLLALKRELAPLEAELKERGLAPDAPLRTARIREGGPPRSRPRRKIRGRPRTPTSSTRSLSSVTRSFATTGSSTGSRRRGWSRRAPRPPSSTATPSSGRRRSREVPSSRSRRSSSRQASSPGCSWASSRPA